MTAPSAPRARPRKTRLDVLLVERGLAPSRERARALVMARDVLVDGEPARRAAAPVSPEARVELKSRPPYVSRGGEKLADALRRSGVRVAGARCLDVGASTGGFTDCLLQAGAAHVTAVDVGYGQIAPALRDDPRVTVRERVNARELEPLVEPVDLCVMDVSFISVTAVLPAVLRSVRAGGELLVLVKPQFEAGRDRVGRGGVVRDPLVHASAVAQLALFAIDRGLRVRGVLRSPLLGPAGNREFFLWLEVPGAAGGAS